MLQCCCKRSKLFVGLLVKGSKIYGSDAVQGTNWFGVFLL